MILEAAGSGLPAVGSADCGIESVIKNGYSGYLARQGDWADIAEKIKLILEAADKGRMSNQAKEFASRFSWPKAAREFTSEYE